MAAEEVNVAGDSPIARRRRLGRLLRDLREQAALTGDEAGAAVERSASWISRIESGQAALRQRELRDLLVLYGLEDVERRSEFERLAEAGRQRGWWHEYADSMSPAFLRYVGLEADAKSIFAFEDRVIPGLLQSPSYMRALHSLTVPTPHPDLVETRIRVRTLRQSLLGEDRGPHLATILDEAVLRREVGGQAVLREQLAFLLRAVDGEVVELQVLTFANRQQVMPLHAFTLLRFEADPPVVFVDTLGGGFFEEGPPVEREYATIFGHLRTAALDPQASRRVIQNVLKDLS